MEARTGGRFAAIVILGVVLGRESFAEERTWKDATGKFSVSAELLEVRGDKAVLRQSDGKAIEVPIERLSAADRKYLAGQSAIDPALDDGTPNDIIARIAERFYGDLRSRERDVAKQSLTKKAQALMNAGQSPLAGLPEPQPGDRSIKTGEVKLDGQVAEIPVLVRAGGQMHKTKLHLRQEGDQWVVFALSAAYPDGEKSINFEAAGVKQTNVDPLQALVGKPIELEGYTLDGKPLSISQYKGKIVLVDFWATWCGPCRAEIPNILQNYEKHHADGFEVIAVSVDQDLSALRTFVTTEQPPWAVVADNHPQNKKSMAAKFGIRGIPTFVLVGPDGKVAAVHCRGERLGQQVAKLLAQGG